MAMLMAYYAAEVNGQKDTQNMETLDISAMNFPHLVANHHILFMNEKASSSGAIKPPMAHELLDYYTSDQLRMHFLSLGLSKRSVSFNPMALDETFENKNEDPVLKDGSLLTKVFNRIVRSCFYTSEKYNDLKIPQRDISEEILTLMERSIYDFERNMSQHEFHRVIISLDNVIRKLSKYWAKHMTIADKEEDNDLRMQILADMFYGVKVTLTLLHPVVPTSAENVQDYLNIDSSLWSWDHIFEPIERHMVEPSTHTIKAIPPKYDFFANHPSFFE